MELVAYWIFVTPADWDALGTDDGDGGIIPFNYTWAQGVTGYWKTLPDGRTVYDVQGPQNEIDDIVNSLPAATAAWKYPEAWNLPVQVGFPASDTLIVDVMPDHVTYDDEGNETSRTPATFENPNWAHSFLRLDERSFEGEVVEMVLSAEGTTLGSTGYDGNFGDLNPTDVAGDTVIRIETNPALGGIFAIQLEGPTTFESIQSIGTGPFVLNTENAFYNQALSLWFWVGVLPFQFNAETDYIIMIQT
jgi:hypothetical protein